MLLHHSLKQHCNTITLLLNYGMRMMSEALQKMASIALNSLNRSLLLDVRTGLVATLLQETQIA